MISINKYKVISLFLCLQLMACNEDFLTEEPTTFVNPNILLVDKASADLYLNGAYDAIQGLLDVGRSNGWGFLWGTYATDLVTTPRWQVRRAVWEQSVSPSFNYVVDLYQNLYIALNKVNSVVDRVGAMSDDKIDPEDRGVIVAEARTIRAMINFALVSAWENIPLIKNETVSLNDLDVAQAKPEEVYAFIIEDLEFAKDILPEEQKGGHVSKGTAQTLLGKVYLQMTGFPLHQTDKFALAEKELKAVIERGTYSLLDNYPDIFTLENEQSSEIIFAIGAEGPEVNEGSGMPALYGPAGSVRNGGAWGVVSINWDFATSFDTLDIRLFNNVAKHNANKTSPEEGMYDKTTWPGRYNWWNANKNSWRPWKWHAAKPNNYAGNSPFDFIYLRYADVLLMYAEALNGQDKLTQEVIDQTVNKLRARVRMESTAVPDMVLGTKEANATELLSERAKELCFEGWRRNDLIRFGVYPEAISIEKGNGISGNPANNYAPFKIRWPIPFIELSLNPNLKQNEGY